MKHVHSGFLSKVVVLILLVAATITLLNVQSQIQTAQQQLELYQSELAQQQETNAALADNIANSDDPDTMLDVAKEKLGLLEEGEVVFYDTTN